MVADIDNVVKFCYWDASALIPIFINEGRSSETAIRLFQDFDSVHYASEYTKAEVLNKIKSRFFKNGRIKKATKEEYVKVILRVMLELRKLKILGPDLDGNIAFEAIKIADTYDVDVIDAAVILGANSGLLSLNP